MVNALGGDESHEGVVRREKRFCGNRFAIGSMRSENPVGLFSSQSSLMRRLTPVAVAPPVAITLYYLTARKGGFF